MSPTRVNVRPPPLALLVEHDGDTRDMYAEWLRYSGFRVAEAATADEAIAKAQRLRPHIITTDIGLSADGDGCSLCERLKADERTRAIPVIAVTAWAIGHHAERARRAGCDSVLLKPCLPDELLAEIQRLLNLPKTPRRRPADPSPMVVLTTPSPLSGLLQEVATEAQRRARLGDAPVIVLRQLVDALGVSALVADNAGRYIVTNADASELTGYSTDELHRLSVWQLTPDANAHEAETLWRAFVQQGEQSGDYQLLTKSGHIVTAEYAARAHVLPNLHVSLLRRR